MVSANSREPLTAASAAQKKVTNVFAAWLWASLLMGCNSTMNIDSFDPIGKWTDRHGFSISLFPNGKFEFCDNSECATGYFERPYGENSYAITLKNFFNLGNVERVRSLIERFDPTLETKNFPDLDFSANYGLLPDDPKIRYCEKVPCVVFGAVESFYEKQRLVFELK